MTLPDSDAPAGRAGPVAAEPAAVTQPGSLGPGQEPPTAEASEARFTIAVWQLATILAGMVIAVCVLLLGVRPPTLDVSGLPPTIKLLVPALLVALLALVLARKRESERRSSSES
ncbi:MAG: hypothetical protein ABR569_05285 [Gaiellaceae bacterium]